MRIAVIAPPWLPVPPPAYGGTETVIDGLVRGFSARGHDVLLCTTGDATAPVPRHAFYAEAQHARIGNAACELAHLVDAYEVARTYDVVHDHTVIGPFYANRHPEVPVVTTNHGPFDEEFRLLYRNADRAAVVAISHHHASTADGVPVRAVIHHGIDLPTFPEGRGEGAHLAFLGRMTPDKGVCEAIAIARDAGVPLLIGAKMREGAERAFFEAHVRPALGGGIEYLGELGPAEKVALLGSARALLNPIQWPEPFGLVMVESLACGTPVLAHPRGAAPEIVDDRVTGFLPSDHESMVARVADLDALSRAACRRAAEERFSVDRMVEQHLSLYADIIAEHPPSSRRNGRPAAAPVTRLGRPAR
ncbi:MAG TPA: glycosyltransferase family 4 protein [Acidimicrobiales bacterium]|nr:glycosyltransferase family 4 protein [Acidimicrobiales bacterium]